MGSDLQKKNRRIALYVFSGVAFMIMLSFASVPLYRLFCQVTGFGGTTQIAEALPDTIITDRFITVRFNTDTAPDLLWDFKAQKNTIIVNPGQKGIIAYTAENNDQSPIGGAAVYNVTPPKAGKYFHKIQCFCFEEQILQPQQEVTMPVMFYVDPAIVDDPAMNDVKNITLSYTFFKTDTEALEQALEDFYNQPSADDTLGQI